MVIESFAVVIIVIAIMVIYLRAGRHAYAIAVIPLSFVPAANLLATVLSGPVDKLLPFTKLEIHIGFNLLAALLACACFGVFSTRFHTKSNRTAYLFTCVCFTIVFTAVTLNSLGLFS